MIHLPTGKRRLPVLGGLVGLGALGGVIAMLRNRGSKRRPMAAKVLRMDDASFQDFIRSTGLETVTTLGLVGPDGNRD